MTSLFSIAPVTALHPDMKALQSEAALEGFRFIDKLIADWSSAANRFDRAGELFLGGFREGRLEGVCGLNRDPYIAQTGVGRLRHLYVRKSARRSGIASALVQIVIDRAEGTFKVVRLRTDSSEAAEFYTKFGFISVNDADASHVKLLSKSCS